MITEKRKKELKEVADKIFENSKDDAYKIAAVLIIGKINQAMNNPFRRKILNLIKTRDMNIREISKLLGISYKSTWVNVQKLHDVGLVELDKNPLASGQAVSVHYEGYEKAQKTLAKKLADN